MPIVLFNIFNFDTKFILRISGYPKLNLFRKNLWKFLSKKIYNITCPSEDLKSQLIKDNIFLEKKLFFLPDPIINIKKIKNDINTFKIKKNINDKKYFIAVGRLTKQKNFLYLIDEFYNYSQNQKEYNLLIFGEGEERVKLEKKIKYFELNKKVFLMGFSEHVLYYMKQAEAFILSSLWEDPGFVIIEAAFCNLLVVSSDCNNGPNEFLLNGKGGILYEKNKKNKLKTSLNLFENLSKNKKNLMRLNAKKNCIKYTLLRHHNRLREILNFNLS